MDQHFVDGFGRAAPKGPIKHVAVGCPEGGIRLVDSNLGVTIPEQPLGQADGGRGWPTPPEVCRNGRCIAVALGADARNSCLPL